MTTESAAVDNDILLKLACYWLLSHLRPALGSSDVELHVLGAARYVIRDRLAKSARVTDREEARREFDNFLSTVSELEPSADEILLSTRMEELALEYGLELDTGESQLCAITVSRSLSLLATGDKRAISGIESLVPYIPELLGITGKILPFEVVMLRLSDGLGPLAVRSRVCTEALADKAMTICFGCRSDNPRPVAIAEGLSSYIRALRVAAPNVLVPGEP